ncbi:MULTISPECIES: hypothetical protein [unclassified Mesorhizobium]|uniref:hypothetical protein n=1 Tax=unclassified Mesorhizobium TaxID=325217 RepID=UPI0012E33634|nr:MULTISPECIES: hypothetical protein [unclassified Mesorhizobium]
MPLFVAGKRECAHRPARKMAAAQGLVNQLCPSFESIGNNGMARGRAAGLFGSVGPEGRDAG